MMKKLLAIVLAAAMLCALAGIGASATTPEEEAWALVEGTQKIFESGTFTAESYGDTVFATDGNRMVTEGAAVFSFLHGGVANAWFDILFDSIRKKIAGLLLGERSRLITTPEGNFLAFPQRRMYAQIDPGIPISTASPDKLRALWPDHSPDTFTVKATPENPGRVEADLCWGTGGKPMRVRYSIYAGAINYFAWGYDYPESLTRWEQEYRLKSISARADESYFSMVGMTKLPWWLMKILIGVTRINYSHFVGDYDPYPMVYKPVIYLYPEQPAQVNVTLQTRDAHLAESIPDYGAGWNVLARPDGTLTNLADGIEYPYLFWEAALETPWPQPKEGFVVAREDLAGFLDEKLRFLGLNGSEAGEFIEFWLPKLAENEYSFLHFAGKEYTDRFPLGVSPAPDSLLRVFLVARAAEKGERAPAQALAPFERKGFAVVEWGGTML